MERECADKLLALTIHALIMINRVSPWHAIMQFSEKLFNGGAQLAMLTTQLCLNARY